MTSSSHATFDALQITSRLAEIDDGASESEVHVMCYLASMLHVFAGDDATDWGYDFAATGSGAPFADEVDDALGRLYANGLLELSGGLYSPTQAGESLFLTLASHGEFSRRTEYLSAAANTALAMTLPIATSAVMHEPQLEVSISTMQRRQLLDAAGCAILDPYFSGLRELLGSDDGEGFDLFSVAVLWLRYLRRAAEGRMANDV